MKKRIWELDAARGVCIIGMVIFHLLFDLQTLFQLIPADKGELLTFVGNWGGVLFFLISGICVTLGSHPIRRGGIVVGCGLVVSAVLFVAYKLNFFDKYMLIYFGVLHCLGVCMLLWPLFRKLPWYVLLILGAVIVAVGLYIDGIRFDTSPWLIIFGFKYPDFGTADYFPLMPYLGFFLLGAVLGKTLYRNKCSLFPKVPENNFFIRFLTVTGRLSLPIYMLHQPVLTGILFLVEVIR